jgi:hypothetical protein
MRTQPRDVLVPTPGFQPLPSEDRKDLAGDLPEL